MGIGIFKQIFGVLMGGNGGNDIEMISIFNSLTGRINESESIHNLKEHISERDVQRQRLDEEHRQQEIENLKKEIDKIDMIITTHLNAARRAYNTSNFAVTRNLLEQIDRLRTTKLSKEIEYLLGIPSVS